MSSKRSLSPTEGLPSNERYVAIASAVFPAANWYLAIASSASLPDTGDEFSSSTMFWRTAAAAANCRALAKSAAAANRDSANSFRASAASMLAPTSRRRGSTAKRARPGRSCPPPCTIGQFPSAQRRGRRLRMRIDDFFVNGSRLAEFPCARSRAPCSIAAAISLAAPVGSALRRIVGLRVCRSLFRRSGPSYACREQRARSDQQHDNEQEALFHKNLLISPCRRPLGIKGTICLRTGCATQSHDGFRTNRP